MDLYLRCRVRLKVKYGQPTSAAAPENEHALKAYWRHLNNFYFKRLDETDTARLDYLRGLLAHQPSGTPFPSHKIKPINFNFVVHSTLNPNSEPTCSIRPLL